MLQSKAAEITSTLVIALHKLASRSEDGKKLYRALHKSKAELFSQRLAVKLQLIKFPKASSSRNIYILSQSTSRLFSHCVVKGVFAIDTAPSPKAGRYIQPSHPISGQSLQTQPISCDNSFSKSGRRSQDTT